MKLWPAILVFGSAAAGYVYTHPEVAKSFESTDWLSEISDDADLDAAEPPDAKVAPKEQAEPEVVAHRASAKKEQPSGIAETTVADFGKIFRFDLTPQTIQQRWTRVSTSVSEEKFQAYRVPLVTGTADNDLAGSLTYYFDRQSNLRRITFLGTTGNPKRIVGYMAKYYGFKQSSGKSGKTVVYRTRSRFTGELSVSPTEAVGLDGGTANFQVVLSLAR
jgi:hypothetical protein